MFVRQLTDGLEEALIASVGLSRELGNESVLEIGVDRAFGIVATVHEHLDGVVLLLIWLAPNIPGMDVTSVAALKMSGTSFDRKSGGAASSSISMPVMARWWM
jgi:hypothetical protein